MTPPRIIPPAQHYPGLVEVTDGKRTIVVVGDSAKGERVAWVALGGRR